MTTTQFQAIIDALLGARGVAGLLVAIMVLGFFEVWVWGKAHRARVNELRMERDRWQQLALSTTTLARESLTSRPTTGA